MTFLEAAIEILRHADEPLHYADVARRAVAENLLSHVGRDPETAMRSCLNSASRIGRDGSPPLIERDKPGFYGLRAGAELPPPAPRPTPPPAKAGAPAKAPAIVSKAANDEADADEETSSDDEGLHVKAKAKSRTTSRRSEPARGNAERRSERGSDRSGDRRERGDRGGDRGRDRGERGGRGDRAAAEPAPVVERAPARPVREVEFVAPTGSGLEGVTDVALVMANAMSRLVEERPELKEELDAMQHQADPVPSPAPSNGRSMRVERVDIDRGNHEERSGRRRRRRRRRGKRVEWSGGGDARPASAADRLLDDVAAVLEQAGPRSLHVRQIAEQLAAKGLLGGEVSELERAVTAALLVDIRSLGRASRFCARGDARYVLQGARLPERAGKAEAALRAAVRDLEQETQSQFVQWLQSLGARALECLVRIWLRRESYALVASLPPSRGIGRLVVEDPDAEDDDAKLLVVVVPRRTPLDPKLWEGDPERHGCGGLVVVSMGEAEAELGPEARVLGAGELAGWLREQGIGVQRLTIEVPVLDPTVIESVAGLDS